MLVYGKLGQRSPYAIKILTNIQLSNILLLLKKKKNIVIKGLSLILFCDSTHE
jgi:hypothetical protein